MKKIILVLLLTVSNSFADYVVSGHAERKGGAYITAMSKAPSGNHWVLSGVTYGRTYRGYSCTIIWKQN
jgi:L-cysteine desulfidase